MPDRETFIRYARQHEQEARSRMQDALLELQQLLNDHTEGRVKIHLGNWVEAKNKLTFALLRVQTTSDVLRMANAMNQLLDEADG